MSKYDHKRKHPNRPSPYVQTEDDPHIIDSHTGDKVFYKGRGKKGDTNLKQFDNKRDKYWDKRADEWIKKNTK